MAKKRTRIPLNVLLNDRLVGQLRRQASGAIDFQYDPTWLEWEHTFPVSLSLLLREERYIGDPVIAVFDNLLPDNHDVRRAVAARQHADGIDAYSLLAAIGRDCVGALQFVPAGEDAGKAGVINAVPISDQEIAEKLTNLATAPLGMGDDRDFRISIAGAQEKAAFLYWEDRWHVPHGSTATTHIFKPQIGIRGNLDFTQSAENEHLCMRIVDALDIPVATTEIAQFEETRALVIERFDRLWTKDARLLRKPQEDCCQALSFPPTRKYQSDGGPGVAQILDFLKGSDELDTDQRLFMKAQIVFWLLAATDGHAKNFSVFLFPGGGFRLTPLYDVMSTQPLFNAGQLRRNAMKLAMSVGNSGHYRLHEIMPRHFIESAAQAGMPAEVVQSIVDELKTDMPAALDAVCNELPDDFPESIRNSICNGARERLRRL
jgi:serine/threonine-protein kinase HipA